MTIREKGLMGGNSRTNLPAEGGRDHGFADMDLLRRRIRGYGRDDSFGLSVDMGGEERTGDLERIEREILIFPQMISI